MREEIDGVLVIDMGEAGSLECPAVYSVDAEWDGGVLEDWSVPRLEWFNLGSALCYSGLAMKAIGKDAVDEQAVAAAELWAETAEQQRRWAAQEAAE